MLSRFHFLVVDDLPSVRWIVSALLREIGCTTISEAGDGKQALSLLQSGPAVDFILTDWKMPVMDGIALLRAIRASTKLSHLPVLMITAEAEDDSVAAAVAAGADGYIVKTLLSAAILRRTVDGILKKKGLT
ncbi:response regulator [Noviherbaspirillum sp. ST9]|uniref:response regulator n=1 Tax=Noviherbaspirillum sp. ST9 TaxID=3401606 RepID=UPI003B589870